jgi:hypothetical protein
MGYDAIINRSCALKLEIEIPDTNTDLATWKRRRCLLSRCLQPTLPASGAHAHGTYSAHPFLHSMLHTVFKFVN